MKRRVTKVKLQLRRVADANGADLTPESVTVASGRQAKEYLRAKEPFRVAPEVAAWLTRTGEFEPFVKG